jgi:4a-hydroxytetrahydrobiopterin dehydratase
MPLPEIETTLDEAALARLLRVARGWTREGETLTKTFTYRGWKHAIEFVDRVAKVAEKLEHHPDIHIEGYKKVRIVTTTHATNKLSDADLYLAYQIEAVADPYDYADPTSPSPRPPTLPRA